ncbi:hypothetical protein PAHAL_1G307800 [Panicum hallii]|uniref:Uncharacterized protein n=1 Tax=Panicum hallii TaxID=206008 RepID=A0A2T8KWV8_9POAL|nr:hypothetical protein PAHAL_1G307800 [Panicum hallii]
MTCAILLHQYGLQGPAKSSALSMCLLKFSEEEHLPTVISTDFLYPISLIPKGFKCLELSNLDLVY